MTLKVSRAAFVAITVAVAVYSLQQTKFNVGLQVLVTLIVAFAVDFLWNFSPGERSRELLIDLVGRVMNLRDDLRHMDQDLSYLKNELEKEMHLSGPIDFLRLPPRDKEVHAVSEGEDFLLKPESFENEELRIDWQEKPSPSKDSGQTSNSRASGERRINAWIKDGNVREPLVVGDTYTLLFNVGDPVIGTLLTGNDAVVRSDDVPKQGLQTQWTVRSTGVWLGSTPDGHTIVQAEEDGATSTATFSLLIPAVGTSDQRSILIRPLTESGARLEILIFVGKRIDGNAELYRYEELYRKLSVVLNVARETGSLPPQLPVRIQDDIVLTPAGHANLKTFHEWTSPPGRLTLTLTIRGASISADGDANGSTVHTRDYWSISSDLLKGLIKNVRQDAETFRSKHQDYLNALPADDVAQHLKEHFGSDNWTQQAWTDETHEKSWATVEASQELRDLAVAGYVLYNRCFPKDSHVRSLIDALKEGYRIDIIWFPEDRGGVASVPWSLMYRCLPDAKMPIDPLNFLGLRYRIGYIPQASEASKALGDPSQTHRAYCFYWGNGPEDQTGVEAAWQQKTWSGWQNQRFVPDPGDKAPKDSLQSVLLEPSPKPVNVLYLFCQCSVGQGNDPVLRFGPTPDAANTLTAEELALPEFDNAPLVFANACTTAASDPDMVNELEQGFFDRGCRGYLGTETKVPIEFASRFASVFLHYFLRIVAPEPMAAGEAVVQTRRFLWANYRNIGGLFYSYVNQYEVFMASKEEVEAMRVTA